MEACVLQDWVLQTSYKKQTVLVECIRAPDVFISPKFKQVTTFIRSVVLKNADPTTDFMKDAELPMYAEVEKEFERLPLHSAHHILMTLQVIGREHSNSEVKVESLRFYADAVHAQHLNQESTKEYEMRMK
jgi:hypothetical protein